MTGDAGMAGQIQNGISGDRLGRSGGSPGVVAWDLAWPALRWYQGAFRKDWLRKKLSGQGAQPIPPAPSPTPAASVDVAQSAALVPEYGRSVVSTQQEGVVKMAQQIVGLMEEPW